MLCANLYRILQKPGNHIGEVSTVTAIDSVTKKSCTSMGIRGSGSLSKSPKYPNDSVVVYLKTGSFAVLKSLGKKLFFSLSSLSNFTACRALV